MLHPMRILLIGLVVVGLTSQMLQPRAASADSADCPQYQQRRDTLASQLEHLRGAASQPSVETPVQIRPVGQVAGQRRQKEMLLADALSRLVDQQGDTVASDPSYDAVSEVSVLLPPLVNGGQSAPAPVAFLQMEDEPATVRETDDAPAQPVSDDADSDLLGPPPDDERPPPPMPPAPRVQATDSVRESQESLVRQFQGLLRAVSVSAETPDETEVGVETPDTAVPVDVTYTSAPAPPVPAPRPAPARPPVRYTGDPLDQLVDVDFRDVDLTNVVAILAMKADINIIAGAELRGVVTANLRQVPLRVAMETALRMNGLGMIEEDGIYFIIPYHEAAAVNRKTAMVTLEKAEAQEVVRILTDIVSGIRDEAAINISANRKSNTLVISAPPLRVDELVAMAHQLDVAEPKLPTVTEAIALNYSDPRRMMPLVQDILTPRIGQVAGDERARHLVVTDLPVVVEQVKELVKALDIPTKQVMIETMIVDAILNDEADTGVQWLLDSVRRMSRRQAALGTEGRAVGNLQELSFLTDLAVMQDPGGALAFNVLTDKIDWRGLIQLEVRNRNAHLVSNPVLLTLENEPAQISISQEIPYIELSQTGAGGSQTSTAFKDVGTVLVVTPRVTHDNTIITTIDGKESNLSGQFQGIPIEDKREIQSTMRMANGQTVFVGGLRKSSASSTATKIPVLGDVPIVNFLFRSNQRREQINELLVFLTCTVIETDTAPALTPYQQEVVDKAPPIVPRVDAWETTVYEIRHPQVGKEFQGSWRRGS